MPSTSTTVYVTCVGVLYGKFFVTTLIQATKTFAAGMRSPEDSGHFLAKGRKQNYGLLKSDNDESAHKAKEIETRWKRIIMNDLESLPFALFVFGAGVLVDARENLQIGAMVVYTVARIGHTIAYAYCKQPHRAYCWRIGVLATMTGAANAIVAAYK